MASQANSTTMSTKLHRNVLNMPKWVHETNDRIGPKPPPPPANAPDVIAKAPALPPKTNNQPEPDYEVIEFSGQQYSNEIMKSTNAMRPKTPDTKLKCTLCGSNNPWVTCGECAQQIFCASCDDMFHKHPKRKNHVRKAIEQTRPPLPPKVLPGQPNATPPPVAPPRRSKRGMTPLLSRKDQVNANGMQIPPSPTPSVKSASWHERVSSLKRGFSLMNRPLPDTPKTPTTPSDGASSRSTTPKSVFDNIQRPPSVTLEKIKSKASATLDRMALLQQRYRQHKEETNKDQLGRNNSITDHQMPPTQRNGQLGGRGMSTSVFNLNQINRRVPEPQPNAWMGNAMQQAQSMAQLNCINCSHAPAGWHAPHHPPQQLNGLNANEWARGNQFCSQQQLNRSNMSLNVAAGYMMPHQHGPGMMPPPPVFMNQTGMMANMYPYPYAGGMPVMNPGLMAMPPSVRSRATSRAGSRATSPAMSRKSMPMRRKRTTSYAEDELTDDEDSEDDRRSIISNRSGVATSAPRTRQRRMSSASQLVMDDDNESNNTRDARGKMRDRRGSVAKSVQSDWLPGRGASGSSGRQGDVAALSSAMKPSRVYSDLDSESSGTRALVQAKIQEKLNESTHQKTRATKGNRSSDSDTARSRSQKVSTEVQAGGALNQTQKVQQIVKTEKPASESEETDEEEGSEKSAEEVEEEEQENTAVKDDTAASGMAEPNDGDADGDADELGPPPSTPDYEWECEFCTYVNEPNVKICLICCKTPSAMPRKQQAAKTPPKDEPKQTKAAPNSVSNQSEQQKSTASTRKSTTPTTTTTTLKSTTPKSSTSGLTNGMAKLRSPSSENSESDNTAAKKKQGSLEDIWAALDDNIQATAQQVIRNAETKKTQKVSTSCGTSPIREMGVARTKTELEPQVTHKVSKRRVKETGTSPPPQSISTQTYDVLPLRQVESIQPHTEPSMVRANSNTTLYNESRQISRDVPSPLSSFSPDMGHYDQRHTRDPETELYILLKEADLYKFSPEELHAALKYCGPSMNPVQWLRENWHKLIQTVQSLATKYGQERAENIIGTISQAEARDALRQHGGNIWQAVSECIEQRQRKFRDIFSKGNFSREDVVTALTVHQGNAELALMDLSRTQLKPFLMRIRGSPGGVENESGAMSFAQSPPAGFDNITPEIHDFLSANASECLQTPNAAGAFTSDHSSTQLHDPTNDYRHHPFDASYSYNPDGGEMMGSSLQLDDPMLGNKHMLRDLETLIGNMEQNQAKQNEQVLRSIESMLGHALGKRDADADMDPETARILMKSPIATAKSKAQPTKENNKNQLDVKSFVWQHIQEIVPNLVQQVELELMEQDAADGADATLAREVAAAAPEPPPIDAEEFILEEVIAPNIKEATIRENLPPEYVYAAEIANFRMEFDRALDTEQEENEDIYTLDEATKQVFKMYVASKAEHESTVPNDEESVEMNIENVQPATEIIDEKLPLVVNDLQDEVLATEMVEPQVDRKISETENADSKMPEVLNDLQNAKTGIDAASKVSQPTDPVASNLLVPAIQYEVITAEPNLAPMPASATKFENEQVATNSRAVNKDDSMKRASKAQRRQHKRSQLPKTVNRRPTKQSNEATAPTLSNDASGFKHQHEISPQEIAEKPNDLKVTSVIGQQNVAAPSTSRQPRTSRIPVRRQLSNSKLPRPVPMSTSKSLMTLLNVEILEEHKTTASSTDLSYTTANSESSDKLPVGSNEDNSELPQAVSDPSGETASGGETKNTEDSNSAATPLTAKNLEDRSVQELQLAFLETGTVPNADAESMSETNVTTETILIETTESKAVDAPRARTESPMNDLTNSLENDLSSSAQQTTHDNPPANHNVPSDEHILEDDEEFQDVVELSSDDDAETHNQVDEESDAELYSVGSGGSSASKRDGTIQSMNSTSEMLLVLGNEQQVDTIQPSTSNTTVNSVSSQVSKPTSSKDFVHSGDPSKQNLSELVEDTQRLIKQMKDEITIEDFESSEEEFSGDYTDDDEYDDGEEEGGWDESLSAEYDDESLSEDEIDEDESYFDEGDEEGLGEEEVNDVKPLSISNESEEKKSQTIETEQKQETSELNEGHNEQDNHNEIEDNENGQEQMDSNIAVSPLNPTPLSIPLDAVNSSLSIETDRTKSDSTVALTTKTIIPINNNNHNSANSQEINSIEINLSSNLHETAIEDIHISATSDTVLESEDKLPELPVEIILPNQQSTQDNSVGHNSNGVNERVDPGIENETSASINAENNDRDVPESMEENYRVEPTVILPDSEVNAAVSAEQTINLRQVDQRETPAAVVETSENINEAAIKNNQSESVASDRTEIKTEAQTSSTANATTKPSDPSRTIDSINNNKNRKSTASLIQTTTKTSSGTIPKQKESKIPKHTPAKKVPMRSKSFSGPPGPIGISSVKTIQQEFLNRQKQQTAPTVPSKNPPPPVQKKKSINEAINKLTQPSTSSGLTSGAAPSGGLFRIQPRIPKKKYHETCFSDDDYDTTTTEEEPEPLELRQRKQSVPVFRTYPSIQEPEFVNPETLIRKFVDENLVSNVGEAQIAAALVSMKFPQDVSLWAAKECSDMDQAIALLQQDCELCMGTYPLNQIVSMLKCTHKCCRQCARTYFTVQITDRSINDCNCPFCKLPELHNSNAHEDENLEYFSNLDIFLKSILDSDVHELFQRKLRDRTLLQDPNFKWCIQCSSGFFARPKQKRLICPDCGSVTCSQCRKAWEKQHEGISCEQFMEWKQAMDPEVQAQGVQEHLAQNGIDCPKCKFRYSLARGGCMHFTCTQCKFEFCYGCGKPFMMGAKCTISSYCAKLGLHAHHPRNCLFYLRDKLPLQLQLLLKENGVPFDEEPRENAAGQNEATGTGPPRCPIQLQKETPKGLVDTVCNGEVSDKHAGLCRTHYVEYLTAKVAKARIDPLPIFDLTDCVQELRRRDIPLPERGPWDTDEIYKNMCAEIIRKNIPLEIK